MSASPTWPAPYPLPFRRSFFLAPACGDRLSSRRRCGWTTVHPSASASSVLAAARTCRGPTLALAQGLACSLSAGAPLQKAEQEAGDACESHPEK